MAVSPQDLLDAFVRLAPNESWHFQAQRLAEYASALEVRLEQVEAVERPTCINGHLLRSWSDAECITCSAQQKQ